MERLTAKLQNGISYQFDTDDVNERFLMEVKDKLGQLEDIEQELGIELSVLVKAMKQGFYYKITAVNGEITDYVSKVELWQVNWQGFSDRFTIFADTYYLKDYGKTWALTKEELEK